MNTAAYKFPDIDPNLNKPFYKLEIQAGERLKNVNSLNENGFTDYQKTKEHVFYIQAMELEGEACFSFHILAGESYLAWEDFLKIGLIDFELRVDYLIK